MNYVPKHCKWLSETEIGSTMQVETKYEKGDKNKTHLFAKVYMIIWQRSRTKMNKALSVLVLFLFVCFHVFKNVHGHFSMHAEIRQKCTEAKRNNQNRLHQLSRSKMYGALGVYISKCSKV